MVPSCSCYRILMMCCAKSASFVFWKRLDSDFASGSTSSCYCFEAASLCCSSSRATYFCNSVSLIACYRASAYEVRRLICAPPSPNLLVYMLWPSADRKDWAVWFIRSSAVVSLCWFWEKDPDEVLIMIFFCPELLPSASVKLPEAATFFLFSSVWDFNGKTGWSWS